MAVLTLCFQICAPILVVSASANDRTLSVSKPLFSEIRKSCDVACHVQSGVSLQLAKTKHLGYFLPNIRSNSVLVNLLHTCLSSEHTMYQHTFLAGIHCLSSAGLRKAKNFEQ